MTAVAPVGDHERVNVSQKIAHLITSAPPTDDEKPGSSPDRVVRWLFTGRGSAASTVSHILEQDEALAAGLSELAGQSWTLATDTNGLCQKLWAKLPTIFNKIGEKAIKGTEPGVPLPSENPVLLQLASAKRESRMEYRPSRNGGLVDEKVRVESRPAGRALTDVARDLARLTSEPLLEPMDWYDPESRLQPLSRCVQGDWSFSYPILGDFVSCAVLTRLANAVDLARRLASRSDVKRLPLRQLEEVADECRDLLWDCPGAQERQHAAVMLQLGLLRAAASSLLLLLPFDSSPEMHGNLRLAVQERLGRSPLAVEEVVRALEWLHDRLQPSENNVTASPAGDGQIADGGGEHHTDAVDDTHEGHGNVPWEPDDKDFISLSEAAATLAHGRFALSTLSRWIKKSGALKHMRKGQRCMVHREDFREFIRAKEADRR